MRRACGDLVPGAGAQQGGVDHPASAQRAPPGRRGSRPCSRPSRRPRVAPCCPVTKPSARHGRSSTGERSPGTALSHRSRWPPAQTRRPCTSGRRRGRQGVQLSDVTRCDRDRMLGHHLDSAVLQDIDDAAAHGLPIGKIDVEGVAWPPSGLRLVHAESMRAPRRGPRRAPPRRTAIEDHTHRAAVSVDPPRALCTVSAPSMPSADGSTVLRSGVQSGAFSDRYSGPVRSPGCRSSRTRRKPVGCRHRCCSKPESVSTSTTSSGSVGV